MSDFEIDAVTGFALLIRAHDHVWSDRKKPLDVRIDACDLIWQLAIEVAHQHDAKVLRWPSETT